MWPIVVIASNTFRENLRDKILYNLLLFAVLLMGASMLLADLTILEHYKIMTDMGLAAINLVGVIIAVFVGIGLVSKEIERRTIYTIVARPISRAQFVVGKYLGLITTLVVNVLVMLSVFLLTLWGYHAPVHWVLVQAVQLIVVELMLITAIALFFSTFSSATLSAIFTIGLYIIGHVTTDLRGLAQKSHSEAVKVVANGVYYLCPNLDMLNMKGQAALGIAIPLSYQALATTYGLLYAGMLIVGACLIFQQRDF
ncbi:MAG TPA: ABC transporter permease [Nitrospiraceae bacterium]|jgi:ABC-type transport system involved in multi-copper enzyme maturation permease subunit